jgi:hypothetical protein
MQFDVIKKVGFGFGHQFEVETSVPEKAWSFEARKMWVGMGAYSGLLQVKFQQVVSTP